MLKYIDPPRITAADTRGQLEQIKSYLCRLATELNLVLSALERESAEQGSHDGARQSGKETENRKETA